MAYVIRRWGALADRISAQVDVRGPDECHPWTGLIDQYGYGFISVDSRPIKVPRGVWMLANGPIPPGQVVRHTCDNPICCNIRHLLLGTKRDNTHDAVERGRMASGERNGAAKLTAADVIDIRTKHATGKVTQRELARERGVGEMTISNIVRRKTWRHLP